VAASQHTTPTSHVARTDPVSSPVPAPSADVAGSIVDPKVTDYDTERRTAASAPVFVDVPGVGNVGADPHAATNRATELLNTLKKGTP
jgi:hypothetical protein